MTWLSPQLRSLQAVALARLDESGVLIEANAGFMRLINAEDVPPEGVPVARFFIQPNFLSLVSAQVQPNGEVHRGLLTIGEYTGVTRSLRGSVVREGKQLGVCVEYDIEELERLNQTVLDLNQSYANTQLDLAQANFKLQQRETLLKQTVDKLTAANMDLKQAQGQLLQSEKLASIGLLAAGVAHEINNPIGFVSSNFGALKEYVDDLLTLVGAYESAESDAPASFTAVSRIKAEIGLDFLKADVASLLTESYDGLDRVKKIVRSLMDFSRVDSVEHWQSCDLHQGIESTLHVVGSELRPRCEIAKAYGNLPLVTGLPSQLNQVFMNLLLNAAQAIESQGVVTIRSGGKGDEVWIEFADTGCGIVPTNLPHIFDPFFTTRPIGKGAGLGLSVAYGIVDSHHGRIEVSSEVGKGSVFRVWLPIHQPASA